MTPAGDEHSAPSVRWAEAAELPLCLLSPDMQHRRIVDRAFARAGVTPRPAVETNSVSTLDRPCPHRPAGRDRPHLAATRTRCRPTCGRCPLVDPEIEYTIGIVTQLGVERAPIVAELLSLFAPLELDG